jgi:hypothetical protein
MYLDAVFADGQSPTVASLFFSRNVEWGDAAEWCVNMLTGPIPDMGGSPLHHRKRFTVVPDGIVGVNILRARYRWGRFVVSHVVSSQGGCMMLDYDRRSNLLTRSVRDLLRTTSDPNVLIGKFCLGRNLRFLAYFSLTRLLG